MSRSSLCIPALSACGMSWWWDLSQSSDRNGLCRPLTHRRPCTSTNSTDRSRPGLHYQEARLPPLCCPSRLSGHSAMSAGGREEGREMKKDRQGGKEKGGASRSLLPDLAFPPGCSKPGITHTPSTPTWPTNHRAMTRSCSAIT